MNQAHSKAAEMGVSTLSPHLVCAGASEAMDFYAKAFGAKELARMKGPNGRIMHGCMQINGGTIMLVDANPDWGMHGPDGLGGTPVTLHLVVDDADAWQKRAIEAGATETMPVADMFWGDRYGEVRDPWGHAWAFATPQRSLSEAEILEAMKQSMDEDCQS
ncbi:MULTISPECIES: VOC family protein [Hyphobacterium]|uniref:VOC family protein n=1 Tax=Hyphobacterium vulgare TaxID=1736751 RepID=A0ABV7A0J3_9PROT